MSAIEPTFSFRLGEKKTAVRGQKKSRFLVRIGSLMHREDALSFWCVDGFWVASFSALPASLSAALAAAAMHCNHRHTGI